MNKIDELEKKAKENKRKEKRAMLEGVKSVPLLLERVNELVDVIKESGADYKEAVEAIYKERNKAQLTENHKLVEALDGLKALLPKTIQKVSINNPGALQIDYKKLNSIADEVVKNFILNQNEHFNSFAVSRNQDDKVTQIKTEYDKFSITTKYRRNSNGKLMGGTASKTNK